MHVDRVVEKFNGEFNVLIKEQKELRRRISEQLVKKVESSWPIVKALKENNVYFTHPDVEFKTTHGIIVGKDHKNYSVVYVCKEPHYVHKLSAHDDKIDGSSMLLLEFLKVADLDFAIRGIDNTINRPAEVVEEIERKIEKEKLILQTLLQV